MMMERTYHNYQSNYIHHNPSPFDGVIREIVFGVEDGMVSTLGAITGIAVGSQEHSTVLLAGFVIIAVESISMGIGSYLSNRSEEEIENRKLMEEKNEIEKYPSEEKEELAQMYRDDGWPHALAQDMATVVSKDPDFMLREMALRELKVFPKVTPYSPRGAMYMFVSYVGGGIIPLSAYLFLPIPQAIPVSVGITLVGLFSLGAITTKLTKEPFVRAGLRMLLVGGIALVVGLVVGSVAGSPR
ncbi:VIT1/CCC1 transporter family protein [Candidatus Uhrbacteria bacterium]|nr:VIT1/CCC1 transporter family protein [Candidatus Uhrbacteria bacterium]